MKKRILKFILIIIFILSLVLFFTSIYITKKFGNIPFEQILYSVVFSKGASKDVLKNALIYIVPRCILFCIFAILIQFLVKKYIIEQKKSIIIPLKLREKYNIQLFNFSKIKKILYYIAIVLILNIVSLSKIGFFKYIYLRFQVTKIYESYYIDPMKVDIVFPEEKRNLIYIVVESQESTNISSKNGGAVKKSYIPLEEKLALNYTNFSNTSKIGGAMQITGTTYTAASLVAQTSGTPIDVSINIDAYHNISKPYPGLYTLGEVLEKNGYSNYFLLGSDADFGSREEYFVKHGNYKILDYKYAIENKWIKEDYNVWWGFEDKKLFSFARDELKKISKNKEPFNFTILTADTHFIDGYLDPSCKNNKFDTQYKNVFYCNDKMISDFINWVQKQDFYKKTTIIITGDHLTMQSDFYDGVIDDDYQRTVYNVIINSALTVDSSSTKNREFTVLDLYPTTIASLGAKISGNKLGFGTNLYSNEKTIIEKLGYNYVNGELGKRSNYYNNKILGNTYYDAAYGEKQ